MSRPRVINYRKEGFPPGAIYIGRPSPWGNPFRIGRDGTRDEVIHKHFVWLAFQKRLLERLKTELKGKNLVCYCGAGNCHGDILLELANK